MRNLIALFVMLVFSGSIYAETPPELQGIWVPDIEETLVLMNANMGDIDTAYMKNKYLPRIKRIITKNRYTATSGKREHKSDISFKEKQGRNFVMVLTSESAPEMTVTFIPKENGRYIMQSKTPSDGSGNILWKKQ